MESGVKIPARLVLPASARPNFSCEICGTHFYAQGAFVSHVKRCVKKNRDTLEQLADQHSRSDPLHAATDWEALDFQKRHYGHLLR